MFVLKQQLIKKSWICFSNIKSHIYNNKCKEHATQLTYQAKYHKIDARQTYSPYKKRVKPSMQSKPQQIYVQQQVNLPQLCQENWESFIIQLDKLLSNNLYQQSIELIEKQTYQNVLISQHALNHPDYMEQYAKILDIKTMVQFKFRKFDGICTNLQNQMYLINFFGANYDAHYNIIQLCNQYLLTLILHDHYKLKNLVSKKYQKVFLTEQKKGKRKKVAGDKQNQGFFQKSFKSYFSSHDAQSLQIIGLSYAVLGFLPKSLQQFCKLLNTSQKNPQYLSNFLIILITIGNQNYLRFDIKTYNSAKIRQFVKNVMFKQGKSIRLQDLPQRISTQDAEYLLNMTLAYLHKDFIQWTDLTKLQLQPFFNLIYLIAENYYLNGNKDQSQRVINQLKSKFYTQSIVLKKHQKGRKTKLTQQKVIQPQLEQFKLSNLEMKLLFMQYFTLYDQQKYQQITCQVQNFQNSQKQAFYLKQSVVNDILRSQIYQIIGQSFGKINKTDQKDQFQMLALSNHCVNDTYAANQFENEIDSEQPKDDNRRPIPYHHFNLPIDRFFFHKQQ